MVEWMISSSVLIVFVTAMRYFFRGKLPMRAWYALWLVVAVRLLVPVSFAESGLDWRIRREQACWKQGCERKVRRQANPGRQRARPGQRRRILWRML